MVEMPLVTKYEVFLAGGLLVLAIAALRQVRQRSRGWRYPSTKTRGEPLRPSAVVLQAVFLLTIAVMAYGLAVFLHAPISQVGGASVDKWGRPHTADDYRWFQRWEWTAQVTGAACGLSALYGVLDARRKRQERRDAG
jgi:hypothetical protein